MSDQVKSLPLSSDLTYETSLVFWRAVTSIFFREIRPRGAFHIPREGPVIFVAAPHHNQFLDPLLLTLQVHRETRRRTQFLIAAKSMKRKAVGFFAGLMSSIPVVRAADEAKAGEGLIRLSDTDPCIVLGEGTSFLSQFSPKTQIMLSKSLNFAVAEVVEIISDTELRVKKEFGGENGKGTTRFREAVKESGGKGITYKALPFVDQQEMYGHVYQRLKEGGCIGIFPEGGSHDRTDLLPLKAGVSMMALGAMANDSSVKVKIVPVGLSYFHPHRFRSRAVVEFGAAMDVPEELVNMFKEGGFSKRAAVGKLLDLIYDGLKTVTVRAPDYDTLMLIQAARRLYKPPGQHLTLGQVVELNKRFLEGYLQLKDEPKIQDLRNKVLKYNRLLRDLGLRDHQVPRATKAGWKIFGLLLYRAFLLAIWSALALPGVILNGPIFILASIISRKKAKDALAASTVKVAGRDVLGSWKVLISLGAAPLLYGLYAFIATIVMIRAGAPLKYRLWTPFIVVSALPFIGYAALKFGEAGMDVLKSLRPLIVSLAPGQARTLGKLKVMREELASELATSINEFGPKMYEDFDQWRILVPSASVPPSTGTPGLWRRKSGVGAVDAQGNLLVHPMTWLDERLFGWSKSANRGTSAWEGATRSQEISRAATPDLSEDEEVADYDNVLGYLPIYEGAPHGNHRIRSRQNSYADLQKLRMSAIGKGDTHGNIETHPSPLGEGEGLHFRHGHHERRASLSDGIAVNRIAAVDKQEEFKEVTEELNREIREHRHEANA